MNNGLIQTESCQGYTTMPFPVRQGDEFLVVGKYYMDGDATIHITDENVHDLVGQEINLRTMCGCGLLQSSPKRVCAICVGTDTGHDENIKTALADILSA